ncbi:hypothetical protein NQ015_06515 [Corynebacterium sp. 153RC1]|uniref:hypothetical protein n=1 Tax=unclassified Corynebacterium TaxID=2624378 RepID=UPI00211BA9E9|nr:MULTISPECIES: hypothetical protein [unclassified Corynebacterium]MCQ9352583.1 hypothetical protein [Corynebacterium sp. 209RC1]MCQ9354767.1 hypothetical protein [Corynebacterium sp. 1222RC1]MCQ9356952.1 hypothetical protein [Corynebacterium sp. 122RC1]MCQ9359035.1 hypothetical protein [Corynebacterium sp. 142RC1]MCQ9361420.1 hypothetical protein [Corynebacterium sp. 153RC1]
MRLDQLSSLLHPGYRRSLYLRRGLAAILVIAALLSALLGSHEPRSPVVQYTQEISPGQVIPEEAVAVISVPSAWAPESAATSTEQVAGLISVTHRQSGMFAAPQDVMDPSLTTRNVGNTTFAPETNIVPLKLADPQLASMLQHGDTVDVISHNSEVIAAGGVVLYASSEQQGLALIALETHAAHTVASAALERPLAVVISGARAQQHHSPIR